MGELAMQVREEPAGMRGSKASMMLAVVCTTVSRRPAAEAAAAAAAAAAWVNCWTESKLAAPTMRVLTWWPSLRRLWAVKSRSFSEKSPMRTCLPLARRRAEARPMPLLPRC